MLNILLALRDQESRGLLSTLCQEKGCNTVVVDTTSTRFEDILDQEYDILFLDLTIPGLNIENNLSAIKEIMRELPIIIIAEDPDLPSEISVRMKSIFYFALKPLNPAEIDMVLQAAIDMVTQKHPNTESAFEEIVNSHIIETKRAKGHQWLIMVANASSSVFRVIPTADKKISNAAKLLIPNRLVGDLSVFSRCTEPIDSYMSTTLRKLFDSLLSTPPQTAPGSKRQTKLGG